MSLVVVAGHHSETNRGGQVRVRPREPLHIHARGNGNDAKFWLYPEVRIAYCDGFSRQEQLDLIRAIEAHRDEIERAWNEHFS